MLEAFGIDPGTENVYRAALMHPAETGSQLAARLERDRDDVVRALAVLQELTLVVPASADDADLWDVTPPDRAIETLIGRELSALNARREALEATRTEVAGFVEEYVTSRRRTDDQGLIELIDDVGVIRSRLYQLTRGAQRYVYSMMPGDALTPDATQASLELDRELLGRNVDVRVIVSESSLARPHWVEYLTMIGVAGAQVRSHPDPPQLTVIVDGEVSLVPKERRRGAIVLRGRDLTNPMVALFEQVWQAATPVDPMSDDGTEADLHEARIRQVVRLLAQGHKDETIARRMGISVRTVRRLVSDAVDRLHADSRFQAGVNAARGGWLD